MKNKSRKADTGVLVGRFQVPHLHDGHLQLISYVMERHQKVIIFLGLSPARVTRSNPLDFESRKQMLLAEFPELNVLYIKDCPSDEPWSKKLDSQIHDLVGPTTDVLLYGSRESFIAHYTGKYPTQEMEQEIFVSGVEIRNEISGRVRSSPEFREGVIWAAYNQYPRAMPTVDIAIWNEARDSLLLARKPNETEHRFVGGFVQGDGNFEENARREVAEETHIEIGDLTYVGSHVVDDWRYRRELDKIVTVLFECVSVFGKPTPDDDISELRWFKVADGPIYGPDDLKETDIVAEHRPLFKMLMEKRNANAD